MYKMTKVLTAALALFSAGVALAEIDGFNKEGLPYAKEGFGVRRNFYQSGRLSVKYADIAGMFELNYVGKQPFTSQKMFSSSAENCTWVHQFTPFVLIDGVPYRLTFENTVHYPFGYRSECTLGEVKLRHEFVLDRNAIFRRITVLKNPLGKTITARLASMQAGLAQGMKWRMNAAKNALVTEWKEGAFTIPLEMGASVPVNFPLNERTLQAPASAVDIAKTQYRFDMVTLKPAETLVFWWVFDKAAEEDLTSARIDRVFADFDAKHARDARFETGDAFVDGWLGFTAPMSAAHEIDGRGGFRASPTYWVWGWDAMVHAGALALCGRAAEVKRMLAFHRDTALAQGVLHSYTTDFTQGAPLAPGVQLFWVILLNEYVNATGDEAFKAECMPFARKLVERAKGVVRPGEILPRGIGYYPDFPGTVDQHPEDYALIDAAIYWQGLKAWTALSGEDAADAAAVGREIVAKFWDAKAGLWSDSWDVVNKKSRAYYPLYSLFTVSSLSRGLTPAAAGDFADAMTREFRLGDRLLMFGWGTSGYLSDGNQYGSYYPVTDRTYWNAQNAAGRTGALALFRRIVGRHARVLTYPEGQSTDAVNLDPADYSDELGNKQFFAEKGWLSDALDLWLGLQLETKGMRLNPMNDGKPFAIRGLTVRGTTLDIEMSGSGTCAAYTLNGKPLAEGFVPWAALQNGRNTLAINLTPAK